MSYDEFNISDKKILHFILGMLKNYMMLSFSTKKKGLYRFLQLSNRSYLDLKFVDSYLNLAMNEPEKLQLPEKDSEMKIKVEDKSIIPKGCTCNDNKVSNVKVENG